MYKKIRVRKLLLSLEIRQSKLNCYYYHNKILHQVEEPAVTKLAQKSSGTVFLQDRDRKKTVREIF